MGYHTNALLWFGVDLGDNHNDVIEDTIFAADPSAWTNDGAGWFADRGLTGVVVVRHCHSEAPSYGLAVTTSLQEAARGFPVTLDTRFTDAHPLATMRLYISAALQVLGVPEPASGIGWVLASYFGA